MRQTPLYGIHKRLGAKFMEFAGYDMPLQYTGIIDEHLTVRSRVGIFDVSHMGEIFIHGRDALSFCEWLTPNHVARLLPGQAQYSFLLNERGGVIDDLIVYRLSDISFMLCVNASNRDKDYGWIRQNANGDVTVEDRSDDTGMISVQGPLAAGVMMSVFGTTASASPAVTPVDRLQRFAFSPVPFKGRQVYVSRTGYTGEDGYECFVDGTAAANLWDAIMECGMPSGIKPIGLGARDTLRAEMGYPLYGMELNDRTAPFSAGMGWVIKMDKGPFIGREALRSISAQGVPRKLVGIIMNGKSIPRHQNPVVLGDRAIGEVTTGTYAPSLSRGIAMAYIDSGTDAAEVGIDIRGILHTGTVVGLPFIKK
ncbi:MAG: glycine cleavage system aminomethyltransferase GcvT [Deltaproteobacteria bacterium]|nr:glycine cleavage system aminomethyltransferase GcvT [Deltaproteobacteria bacterium]